MKFLATALLCLLTFIGMATPAAAEILDARGKVLAIEHADEGHFHIVHANGHRDDVVPSMLLFGGDRFEVDGNAVVVVRVDGERRTFSRVTPRSDLTVPPRRIQSFAAVEDRYISALRMLIADGRNEQITYLAVRSKGPVFSADPLAPSGDQFLPANEDHIVLLWRGGATRVLMEKGDAQTVIGDSGATDWVRVAIPAEADPIKLQLAASEAAPEWVVHRQPGAPSASWDKAVGADGAPRRLVRAIWLLKDGPPAWRLFALTELADLSASGYFPADELWRAAQQGVLKAELDKMPSRP
jgi:hypothetical protein